MFYSLVVGYYVLDFLVKIGMAFNFCYSCFFVGFNGLSFSITCSFC